MNGLSPFCREVLDVLCLQRHEAGEPRMGTREVEMAGRMSAAEKKQLWPALSLLRKRGLVTRRRGWVWATEKAYETWLEKREEGA